MSKRPVADAVDADIGLAPAHLGRLDFREGLVVGGCKFLGEGQNGGGAADDQAPGHGARRHGEDQREDQGNDEGAVRAHGVAPLL